MSNNLPATNMARVCLWIFLYAHIYTGIHQYSNPLEPVVDCSVIDHHLHQDKEIHQCEICDFQLTIHGELNVHEARDILILAVKDALPSGPFSEIANLRSSRAPPSS